MSALVADPILAVLVDELMERGLVRDVAVWTDEEAERCRLVAFNLAQRGAPEHALGMVRCDHRGTVRNWWRSYGGIFAVERYFSSFDPPDFALHALSQTEMRAADARWREQVAP